MCKLRKKISNILYWEFMLSIVSEVLLCLVLLIGVGIDGAEICLSAEKGVLAFCLVTFYACLAGLAWEVKTAAFPKDMVKTAIILFVLVNFGTMVYGDVVWEGYVIVKVIVKTATFVVAALFCATLCAGMSLCVDFGNE